MYEVCKKTRVRESIDTKSKEIGILNVSDNVEVVEQKGTRARIVSPGEGWCSIESKSGATILKPLVKF